MHLLKSPIVAQYHNFISRSCMQSVYQERSCLARANERVSRDDIITVAISSTVMIFIASIMKCTWAVGDTNT